MGIFRNRVSVVGFVSLICKELLQLIKKRKIIQNGRIILKRSFSKGSIQRVDRMAQQVEALATKPYNLS